MGDVVRQHAAAKIGELLDKMHGKEIDSAPVIIEVVGGIAHVTKAIVPVVVIDADTEESAEHIDMEFAEECYKREGPKKNLIELADDIVEYFLIDDDEEQDFLRWCDDVGWPDPKIVGLSERHLDHIFGKVQLYRHLSGYDIAPYNFTTEFLEREVGPCEEEE